MNFAGDQLRNEIYIPGTWSQAGSSLYTQGNVGIGVNNPGYPLDVTGTVRATGILKSNGGTNTPQTFNIPNTLGSAQWYKIGTAAMAQGGYVIKVTITAMVGYNATLSQDAIITIYFKTSNNSSVDANGFAGDSNYWVDISNSSGVYNVKWKANAAGISATTYDLYVYFQNFSGQCSFYTVEYDASNVTWTNTMLTGQTDPGAASSTICVATYQKSWYATYTGINTNAPAYALDTVGDINCSGYNRVAGIIQPRVPALTSFSAVTTFDAGNFDLVNFNNVEIRVIPYFNTTNSGQVTIQALDTSGTVYNPAEMSWQGWRGTASATYSGSSSTTVIPVTELASNLVGPYICVVRITGLNGLTGTQRFHVEWDSTGCYAGVGATQVIGRCYFATTNIQINRIRFNLSLGTMTGKYSMVHYV